MYFQVLLLYFLLITFTNSLLSWFNFIVFNINDVVSFHFFIRNNNFYCVQFQSSLALFCVISTSNTNFELEKMQ